MIEGEKTRVPTAAADHDFEPIATLTPVGIFLPQSDLALVPKPNRLATLLIVFYIAEAIVLARRAIG